MRELQMSTSGNFMRRRDRRAAILTKNADLTIACDAILLRLAIKTGLSLFSISFVHLKIFEWFNVSP
jgi:hypothetical protein